MSMSRKEFQEIAIGIKNALTYADLKEEATAIALVARQIADVCKRSNSAFRYNQFYLACGLNEYGQVGNEPS